MRSGPRLALGLVNEVLHDTIQPASLRYIDRGLREAADQRAELVVIEVDTPGGLLESLRSMTTAILGSSVPVVVYVTPSGARAASAGFFLLLAADVAAMAPGTNTGAAHPVMIGSQRKDDSGAADPSLDKAANDAAALARSLAKARARRQPAQGVCRQCPARRDVRCFERLHALERDREVSPEQRRCIATVERARAVASIVSRCLAIALGTRSRAVAAACSDMAAAAVAAPRWRS